MIDRLLARTHIRSINQDRRAISYRPDYAVLTGSPTAAILLQQMLYRFECAGWDAFYKFKEPCTHRLYAEGDSWCEELFFSRSEFDTALKRIGTKITKGDSKTDLLNYQWPDLPEDTESDEYRIIWDDAIRHIIVYWTDKQRVTWFHINETILYKATILLYIGKAPKSLYISKAAKSLYISISETTTENNGEAQESTPPVVESSQESVSDPEPVVEQALSKPVRARSQKQMELDAMVEALVAVFKLPRESIAKKRWDSLRGAGRQLLDVGANPEDVPRLFHFVVIERGYKGSTEHALVKYWPEYQRDKVAHQEEPTASYGSVSNTAAMEQALTQTEAVA